MTEKNLQKQGRILEGEGRIFLAGQNIYPCHIDPYLTSRTVQNLNKDNLRTYIIGGGGIKSVTKLLHF